MKCPYCQHEATNITIHCITYHGDEASISYLTQGRTLQELMETYEYFLTLCVIFSKSPLHHTFLNQTITYLHEGQPLNDAVNEAISDWGHEIHELYEEYK